MSEASKVSDAARAKIMKAVAKLLDRMEPEIGFEAAAVEIAYEALCQLAASSESVETAATVAHALAARLDGSAR